MGEAVGLRAKSGLAVASKRVDANLAVEGEADDRQVRCIGRLVWVARQQLGAPGAGHGAPARLECDLVCGFAHQASHASSYRESRRQLVVPEIFLVRFLKAATA